jgi:hypothetical protein
MSEQEDGYQVTEVTSGAEEEEVLDYEGEGADADMADAQDPVELGAEASGEPLLRTLRAKLRFKEEMVGRVQAESNAHALSARLFEHELEGLKSKVKDLTRDLKDQTDIAVAFQGDCLRLEEELGEYRESVQRLRTEVGALSKENEDLRGQVEDYRDFQQAIGAAAAADADKTAKRLDSAAGGKKPRLNSGTYSSKAAAGASTGNGAGSSGVANSAAGRSAGTASGAQQDGKSWCPFRPDKIRRFCASKSLCLRCYKTGHQKNDCKAATPATGDPPGFQSA